MLQEKEWSEEYLILSKSLGKPTFKCTLVSTKSFSVKSVFKLLLFNICYVIW